MKKKIIIASVSIIVVALIAGLFAAQTQMKPGKWEISMSMDLKNVPFAIPPFKYTQCVTKEDIEKNKNTVPVSGDKKKKCEVTDYKVIGNTVTWKTKCDDGTEGSGEITYKSDSYSGTMQMQTTDKNGKKKTVNYKINGKRTGDC